MKSSTVFALVAVAAGAFFLLHKKQQLTAQATAGSLGNVGGVAHSPDVTTGGVVSALGSVLPSLSTWFGGTPSTPQTVPTDQYSPGANLASTISSPVSASPAVLPYSYKQQNIDTPAMLDTDSLFTPDPITGGSSGGYADDGNDDIYGSDVSYA